MNRIFLLVLSILPYLAVSQKIESSSLEIELADSISLSMPGQTNRAGFPYIRANSEGIYCLGADSFQVYQFDFEGNAISKLPENRIGFTNMNTINGFSFHEKGLLIAAGKNNFNVYDSLNKTITNYIITRKYKDLSYGIFNLYGTSYFQWIPLQEHFIAPVALTPKNLSFWRSKHYHKRSDKVLALYSVSDNKLIISKLIGDRAKEYKQTLLPHIYKVHFSLDEKSKTILLGQEATFNLEEYTLDGTLKQQFGEPGQHLPEKAIALAYKYSINGERRAYNHAHLRLRSPLYSEVVTSPDKNLIFRAYNLPVEDTCQFIKEKSKTPTVCGFIEPISKIKAQIQAQLKADHERPTYIQVYDRTKKLVLDVRVINGFAPFYTDGIYLWGSGAYNEKTGLQTIYKYHITTTEKLTRQ